MNFRQIEAFRAVIISGTVSRAAELMGVTQPNVSRLVGELEEAIGFALFDRVKGRLIPTPEERSTGMSMPASKALICCVRRRLVSETSAPGRFAWQASQPLDQPSCPVR
ncbi:LysR family transcriptional regulator [Sinorhizobium meliloti]|uniref:LysR family transcriptional regulator n=1 Tax=Rhizobium meliloti TaxID=382 RepID=UPI002D7677E4|nr:LysR family transcriptional regulator [Sinorhizobium meliloti]